MNWKGKGRYLVLLAAGMAGGIAGYRYVGAPGADPGGLVRPARRIERLVPESVRIRVEVLNATDTRGLARRATFHLRDLGFDVVGSGNSAERPDSSVVIVRTGRRDWAELASRALGGARIEERPDSSRHLDLTILLGAAWRPPPEAFHP
jgi:hypothetical protein